METKKNSGMFKFFLKMLFLFLFFFFLEQGGTLVFPALFSNFKYGSEVIYESVWAVMVFIVLLLFKNGYIFTQKQEKLGASLKFAWPVWSISIVAMLFGIYAVIFDVQYASSGRFLLLINLLIYCFFIGIVEEFMCRGWLLNEFLERFSNTKKQAFISIILSSLVFGLMHFVNLLAGQNLAMTTMQVINATLLGVMFALIYYKTKNIWSVVIIHAFWDFSLMIGESALLGSCSYGEMSTPVVIYSFVTLAIAVIVDLLLCFWLFKGTSLAEGTKPLSKVLYFIIPIACLVLWYSGDYIYYPEEIDEYAVCPVYTAKYLGNEKEFKRYTYDSFDISYYPAGSAAANSGVAVFGGNMEAYKFSLYYNRDTKSVYFKNLITNEEIELVEASVYDLIAIDSSDYYELLIASSSTEIMYAKYQKSAMSNDNTYFATVKEALETYTVPTIKGMGTVRVRGASVEYPAIITDIGDNLYIAEDGMIYLDSE